MMMAAIAITMMSIVVYLVMGSVTDWRRARERDQRDAALTTLVESTFLDHDSANEALRSLRNMPPKVMWSVALAVPLHFDDQLSRRVVNVIGATTARRRIERLSRSAFWFRRVQAARLAHVLSADGSSMGNDLVEQLLADSSTSVQAATIESFGTDEIARYVDVLFANLNHQNQSVRFSAQQALLRGDGRITEPLRKWLAVASEDLARFGLEVAAHLDDPRLLAEVSRFAGSNDPTMRRLVARATPVGAIPEDLDFFCELLDDPDALVRVTAIDSSTRIDADWLLPQVAARLSDPSWKVRRAAGAALSMSGALGAMYLRASLDGHDPYAADMARYHLEACGRTKELRRPDFDEELDSLTTWAGQ